MTALEVTSFNVVGLTALIAACAFASSAQAHAHLTGAEPKVESRLKGSPSAIRATFSEPLIAAFSSLELTTDKGLSVQIGKVALAPDDRRTLVAPVHRPLPAGNYVVHWRAVSADTHKTAGDYNFQVEP